MNALNAIFKRELIAYFTTPVAYVVLIIFLIAANALPFYMGDLYERGQADLSVFFKYHPWLYLFLVPAISMRLWAEEEKSGTIEMLLTLPAPLWCVVVGKFLAAWAFVVFALLLTVPLWVTMAYLGNPDHGLIVAGYWGSAFMAGAYLSIGGCISACTKNQVIAFVGAAAVCFIFAVSGSSLVLSAFGGWAPQGMVDAVGSLSFMTHFNDMRRGVIALVSVIYYLSFITLWLFLTVFALKIRRGRI